MGDVVNRITVYLPVIFTSGRWRRIWAAASPGKHKRDSMHKPCFILQKYIFSRNQKRTKSQLPPPDRLFLCVPVYRYVCVLLLFISHVRRVDTSTWHPASTTVLTHWPPGNVLYVRFSNKFHNVLSWPCELVQISQDHNKGISKYWSRRATSHYLNIDQTGRQQPVAVRLLWGNINRKYLIDDITFIWYHSYVSITQIWLDCRGFPNATDGNVCVFMFHLFSAHWFCCNFTSNCPYFCGFFCNGNFYEYFRLWKRTMNDRHLAGLYFAKPNVSSIYSPDTTPIFTWQVGDMEFDLDGKLQLFALLRCHLPFCRPIGFKHYPITIRRWTLVPLNELI